LLKEAGSIVSNENNYAEDLLEVFTFYKNHENLRNVSPFIVKEILTPVDVVPNSSEVKKSKKALKVETKPDEETEKSTLKEKKTTKIEPTATKEELKPDKAHLKSSKDKKKESPAVAVAEIQAEKPNKRKAVPAVAPPESSDSSGSEESSEESDSEDSSEDEEQRLQRKEQERRRKVEEATRAAEEWAHRANAAAGDSGKKSAKKSRRTSEDGEPRLSGEAFRRVDGAVWGQQIVSGLEDNSYEKQFGEDGYGAKASKVLLAVRGKDFRHEKTKKKRGSYRGGEISLASNSFKYD